MAKMQVSLLIGLIFVGNGFCQLFENPEISNEEDLMASPTSGFRVANLGPLVYGGEVANSDPFHYDRIDEMNADSFLGAPYINANSDPFHYDRIDEMNADSFLGAPYPNADTSGTLFGDSQYYENKQDIVGSPQQDWQEMNDEVNFVGMEPNEQDMWEVGLQPQIPENSRSFLDHGLFGIRKFDKIRKHRPLTFSSPPHHSGSYSSNHGISGIHSHSDGYGSHGHYGYGSHSHGSHGNAYQGYGSSHKHGHGHGSSYGHGHGSGYGHSHGSGYGHSHGSGYGHSHGSDYGNSHGSDYGNSHGSDYGNNHRSGHRIGTSHGSGSQNPNQKPKVYAQIYELSHAIPKYKKLSHGLRGSHSVFRSNDEMEETMMPNSYEFDQTEFHDMNQASISK